jgi:2-isopropylmalate synthase
MISYANIIVTVKKKKFESKAKGNGPINALDAALRKVLISAFPVLKDVKLVDYKVRILTPNRGTEAVTRVIIESVDKNRNRWSTVGVSANVIDASYIALRDSLNYKLFKTKART